MSDVTINVTVEQGGTIDADLSETTVVNSSVSVGGQIAAQVTGGGQGPPGETGATGGIVPITVAPSAPLSPNVNDLWIDTS